MFAILAPDHSVIVDGIKGRKEAQKTARDYSVAGPVFLCKHRTIEDGDEYAELCTVEDRKTTHYKGVPAADYISKLKKDRIASQHAAKLAREKDAAR